MATISRVAFPDIRFKGRLRASQQDAVEVVCRKLEQGEWNLHIVAPPGSGKTVLGLYIWAHCVRMPALVLSPNSAIQAQWAARTDLFELPGGSSEISTDPAQPGLLTSLTYQAVTMVGRGDSDLDAAASLLWQDRLLASGQAETPDEAAAWIADLKHQNPNYFEDRLAAYRKEVRDAVAFGGDALSTLHRSAQETLKRLRSQGIGLLILDECHHLMGHWGRVLSEAHDLLERPVVLGLTATPPDRLGRAPEDVQRYETFFGPIDFEVPVPALVKERHLAPYQDLAYFVRPTDDELAFIARADEQFRSLVEQLCEPRPADPSTLPNENCEARTAPLVEWLTMVLTERRLPTGPVRDWTTFTRRDPTLADMGRVFLLKRGVPLPEGVPEVPDAMLEQDPPEIAVALPVLDRYVRHGLRRSCDPRDHALAEQAIGRLRILGVQITENGSQPCASPVGRVLAYARAKTLAVREILRAEREALGDSIRAVVVTDFEISSAVTPEVASLLDEEAGGAIAAFRALLDDPHTDPLDPILVTGSTVLVDDDLAPRFLEEAQRWLAERGLAAKLEPREQTGFRLVVGSGRDWCPRVYVALITDLFQRGVTRCLVGTRGLLGEGWDASKVNVLIDLTTVTTSMSVNQLRGRSIRLDPENPEKLSDNWDVVCVADEFSKGLDDYARFIAKHETLFGVTDDGAIERGVGHVHAAFTELRPEGLSEAMNLLNAEMLERATHRERCRALWRLGEPFHAKPAPTLELRMKPGFSGGFPPVGHPIQPWSDRSLTLAIARVVYDSLRETKKIGDRGELHANDRSGGYVRLFLADAAPEDAAVFLGSLHEALGPLHRPRYVIPREIDVVEDTWISKLLPEIVARYLRRRRRSRAMLHAVPSVLATNKELVEVYQRYWNFYISPGDAIYAHHGAGEKMVAEAIEAGQVPQGRLHETEVFDSGTRPSAPAS